MNFLFRYSGHLHVFCAVHMFSLLGRNGRDFLNATNVAFIGDLYLPPTVFGGGGDLYLSPTVFGGGGDLYLPPTVSIIFVFL